MINILRRGREDADSATDFRVIETAFRGTFSREPGGSPREFRTRVS